MAPLVSVEQVSVEFGPQRVLHEVTLPVQRGQTLVVIGESGCGKTVLLKLLIGLLKPTAGRVTFDGRVLTELSERELTRQRLRFGFLFQGAALFDSLSVFDNVALGLREQRRNEQGGRRNIEPDWGKQLWPAIRPDVHRGGDNAAERRQPHQNHGAKAAQTIAPGEDDGERNDEARQVKCERPNREPDGGQENQRCCHP